jgi:hypothetical protein
MESWRKKFETHRSGVRRMALMFFDFLSRGVGRRRGLFVGLLVFACWLHAAEPAVPAPAPARTEPAPDILVYTDGDQVRGRLISREGDTIVFHSLRFGDLRVPAAAAKVIPAAVPAPPAAVAPAGAPKPEVSEGELTPLYGSVSLRRFTLALRDFFGAWHGRFAFSAEVVHDTDKRTSDVAEGTVERKWSHDDVQLGTRYEFGRVDQSTTTDVWKANGSWRHDWTQRLFSVYRPNLEWNRYYIDQGQRADYLLMHHELGAGVIVLEQGAQRLRLGLSENLFQVWTYPLDKRSSHQVESAFAEAEFHLPWRITMTDRSVWYYAFATGKTGWENKFDVNKKFTETFSLGVRYEVRRKEPDVSVQNYSLLHLMLGLDF